MSENCSEHLWKSLVISEKVWISRKTFENYCFNSETVWKPLLALFIADWSSTYVMSISYKLHLRKTNEKQNKLIIRTKQTNFRQKSITERASYCFRSYSPNGFKCYPPTQKSRDKDLKYQNRIRSKTPKTSKE